MNGRSTCTVFMIVEKKNVISTFISRFFSVGMHGLIFCSFIRFFILIIRSQEFGFTIFFKFIPAT